MKCPLDNAELLMTERQGVEIDYCPTCRGVWLDRGELDKLIERSGTGPTVRPAEHKGSYRPDNDGYSRKHKKENFLGEMFDF